MAKMWLMAAIPLTAVLIVCLAWCLLTLQEPGRFIFLPGGDVGLGFRSHAGSLQWIEYAPWDAQNTDYVCWSMPWWAVLVGQAFFVIVVVWRGVSGARTNASEPSPRP